MNKQYAFSKGERLVDSCANLMYPFVKDSLWVLGFSPVDSEVESHESMDALCPNKL